MELKQFVRQGVIGESNNYKKITEMSDRSPDYVIALLEGKGRRKLELRPGLNLYENYYAECFIGLEDQLIKNKRRGAIGVYPGAHYVLWDREDFMNAISIQPELARRAILDLSRRIRIYDAHKQKTDLDLRIHHEIEPGAADEHISGALYEMSFASDDNFPPHLVDQLKQEFSAGSYLIKQGESTNDLFIILSGEAEVWQKDNQDRKKIDQISEGDMAGEMAQFDGLDRSADVIATTDMTVLVFSPQNFHMLFQLHPKWANKLLSTLAERLEARRQSLAVNYSH